MWGHWEIIVIVLIAVLIFGPKKIPELMRGLGKGIKEFKDSMKEDTSKTDESRYPKRFDTDEDKNKEDSEEKS